MLKKCFCLKNATSLQFLSIGDNPQTFEMSFLKDHPLIEINVYPDKPRI